MKSIVSLVLAVAALVEIVSAVTPAYLAQALAAKDKCVKEHSIDDGVMLAFLQKMILPDGEPEKCAIACYLEEMKLVVDKVSNFGVSKASNKEKWNDPSHVSKADEAVKMCVASVSPDGKNKCDFAVELSTCVFTREKEAGIPNADFGNPKRR